jgi:hypothetical protein
MTGWRPGIVAMRTSGKMLVEIIIEECIYAQPAKHIRSGIRSEGGYYSYRDNIPRLAK